MILSSIALEKFTTRLRNRLAIELDCSVYTVDRWIKENEPNGDLTKAAAVRIISEETGLKASRILVEDTARVDSKVTMPS